MWLGDFKALQDGCVILPREYFSQLQYYSPPGSYSVTLEHRNNKISSLSYFRCNYKIQGHHILLFYISYLHYCTFKMSTTILTTIQNNQPTEDLLPQTRSRKKNLSEVKCNKSSSFFSLSFLIAHLPALQFLFEVSFGKPPF